MKTPPRIGTSLVSGILCNCGARLKEASPGIYRCQGEDCPHRGEEVVIVAMGKVLLYPAAASKSPAPGACAGAGRTISPSAGGQ